MDLVCHFNMVVKGGLAACLLIILGCSSGGDRRRDDFAEFAKVFDLKLRAAYAKPVKVAVKPDRSVIGMTVVFADKYELAFPRRADGEHDFCLIIERCDDLLGLKMWSMCRFTFSASKNSFDLDSAIKEIFQEAENGA